MIPKFSNAAEDFKKLNPHIFQPIDHAHEQPESAQTTGASGVAGAGPRGESKEELKTERKLQEQIVGFLERNNTVVIRSRMDRKTSTNVGTPDLLFAVRMRPVAFEVKLPGRKPTKEQHDMMLRMTGNGWACFIIHSYDEAVDIYERIKA